MIDSRSVEHRSYDDRVVFVPERARTTLAQRIVLVPGLAPVLAPVVTE